MYGKKLPCEVLLEPCGDWLENMKKKVVKKVTLLKTIFMKEELSMNKLLVILMTLTLVSVGNAITINGVNSADTWNGYMNVFDTGGNYQWGSGWGLVDLRASFTTPTTLALAPNTNCWNDADPYWVVGGVGNKSMEANTYREWYYGNPGGNLGGQTVNFNYFVQSNTLPAGYTAQAFIKVLDPSAGWATVQSTFLTLTPGAGSLSLTVGAIATPVTQVGFYVRGLVMNPYDPAASTSVVITPEPTTMALLALGGLLLRKRK
jgi:hypothetical protein